MSRIPFAILSFELVVLDSSRLKISDKYATSVYRSWVLWEGSGKQECAMSLYCYDFIV